VKSRSCFTSLAIKRRSSVALVYVALLRGINVGGRNKVDMKQLKAVFEEAGATEVRTYINSGNVVFSSPVRSRARLARLLEDAIRRRFGFEVDLLVRDVKSMRAICNCNTTRKLLELMEA
jgi:uncharacterized protein (DUF1697 family)